MITPELLESYLACPTKCYLQFIGEKCSGNKYAAWYQKKIDAYRCEGMRRLASSSDESACGQLTTKQLTNAQWRLAIGQTFEVDDLSAYIHAIQRLPAGAQTSELVPVRFVPLNRLCHANQITVGFDTLVLSRIVRRTISFAKIIHGDSFTTSKVRVAEQVRELAGIVSKVRNLLAAATPPDLVLNRHCPECEFRDRCLAKAIEKDDLSLLTGLNENERARLNRRGIFTVNQLSHTFRPRRRPKRLASQSEKYHHSLRALALRENKIHVIGKPRLGIRATSVFFDVESLPDRDFYYLIGIRIETGDRSVVHSLWADTVTDERTIWTDFLSILSAVQKPLLIHYGSVEAKFLKKMCDRYGSPPNGSVAAEAIASPLNLLSQIYARIYLPSRSNGLKDNARFLGFEWTDKSADGLQAIARRHLWEESHDPKIREELITYNKEDCEALSVVARALSQLTYEESDADKETPLRHEIVQADAIKTRTSNWQKFQSPISDFEKINLAARWDYQRDRVFVRSGTATRRITPRHLGNRKAKKAQKVVLINTRRPCPRCQKKFRRKGRLLSRTVQDLIFGKNSIKRRVVQYVAQTYTCRSCGHEWGLSDLCFHGRNWGWNIIAYFIYSAVGLRIPQLTLQHSINRLFGCHLVRQSLNEFKMRASRIYLETEAAILDRILNGNVIHADETHANIKGHQAYVWVLTNLTDVVYILTETREGETVQQLLKGFRGVLVSDFYAAYDSIECPQQKCLVHLMRDLNDEILNNPFDEEAKLICVQFATLLRAIVGTIDRRGLRTHFLRKHLKEVDRFYAFLNKSTFRSEIAQKVKQRFDKNRERLFTFLRYDGVPWNNNNAEHAVKAFARLRQVILGSSTKKGIEEYLTLLSVSETCKCRGIDFLDFLRSGQTDIAAFAQGRR
jgi:predicted RecB family nuclease